MDNERVLDIESDEFQNRLIDLMNVFQHYYRINSRMDINDYILQKKQYKEKMAYLDKLIDRIHNIIQTNSYKTEHQRKLYGDHIVRLNESKMKLKEYEIPDNPQYDQLISLRDEYFQTFQQLSDNFKRDFAIEIPIYLLKENDINMILEELK